jgi:hypothetical protein
MALDDAIWTSLSLQLAMIRVRDVRHRQHSTKQYVITTVICDQTDREEDTVLEYRAETAHGMRGW